VSGNILPGVCRDTSHLKYCYHPGGYLMKPLLVTLVLLFGLGNLLPGAPACAEMAYLIYDGNGNTAGIPPDDVGVYQSGAKVTVQGNTGDLAKAGYTFAGWNTATDGSGMSYLPDATFTITGSTTFYAIWIVPPAFIPSSPVSWWKGDGNAIDSAGSSHNHGAMLNTTSIVSEGNQASVSCGSGTTITAYTATYGTNCKPTNCGSCTLGATSCSVTFDNNSCGEPCLGTKKQGILEVMCGPDSTGYGAGRIDKAFSFDGTSPQNVAIPHSPSFTFAKGHSVAFWVKLDGTPGQNKFYYLVNKWQKAVEDKRVTVDAGGHVGYFLFPRFSSELTSKATLTQSAWNHVVVTYDGTTATIYINGAQDSYTTTGSGNVADGVGKLYLGYNPDRDFENYEEKFHGQLDEVGWYDRALSSGDVKSLYYNPTFSESLPHGVYNTPYSQTISAEGGPYQFTIDAVTLPPGLNLVAATGILSGTPSAIGAYRFTVRGSAVNPEPFSIFKEYSLVIDQASQTIIFPLPSPVTYGAPPVNLAALVTKGAAPTPVTFSIVAGGTGSGSLSGANNATLTITKAGTIKLKADQAGDTKYLPALSVPQTLTVNPAGQTIIFTQPPPVTYGAPPVNLAPLVTKGAASTPVTFSIVAGGTGSGSLSGANNATLTITKAGTIKLKADQAGDTNYLPALSVPQTLTVNPAGQTITFPLPSPVSYGAPPVNLAPLVTKGAAPTPVTFSIVAGGTGSGSLGGANNATLTITKAGTIFLKADQAGDANYLAAPSVPQTLTVNKADQAITFPPATKKLADSPVDLSKLATGGGSGNPLTFTLVSGPGALGGVNNATLTISGVGGIVVRASQAGNDNFNAAPDETQTIKVVQPVVTRISPASAPIGMTPTVTITGLNFTGATVVKFGLKSAVEFTVASDTKITATPPSGLAGTVDVTVTTPVTTSDTGPADRFSWNETLSVGGLHTCGLKPDGSVACWGYNTDDQAPASVAGSFTQVSTGAWHTCGLKPDGSVTCWGSNRYDQAPTAMTGPFTQVSAGGFHTCGLKPDGSVACWGYNDYGQAPSSMTGPFTQVSEGVYHTCGLKPDGSVTCWGYNNFNQAPGSVAGPFTQVSAGGSHTCGLKPDGSVTCWGYNGFDQAPVFVAGPFTQVNAGGVHTCGLKPDRSVTCWGYNINGQAPSFVAGPFTQVNAGGNSTCGVKSDGSVTCWGDNTYGQTPALAVAPTSLPNGAVGTLYTQTMTASGGQAPYTFKLVAGSLPPGLVLNSTNSTGVLSGTPTAGGWYRFTVEAVGVGTIPITGALEYMVMVTPLPPSSLIGITKAQYGSTGGLCDATHAVMGVCGSQATCQITAGNALCGDPTPNVAKALTVSYMCGTAPYTTASIAEGQVLSLSCTPQILTITKMGSGTVVESPDRNALAWNGATGSAGYNSGDQVTLTATPDPGVTFAGWSGACTGTGTCTVTMDGPKSVTATFGTVITVTTSPAGRSITVDGATYTAPQNFTWAGGSSHTIAAPSPQAGGVGAQYLFSSWSDGGAQSHSVTPAAPTTYTANFATYYTLSTSITGSGSVNSGDGIACSSGAPPGTCAFSYLSGTKVTLRETVSASTFSGWGEACAGCGSTAACLVTVDGVKNCSATFDTPALVTVTGMTQPFALLQAAYAAAGNGAIIKAQALTFIEHLLLNNAGKTVTVKGGYDPTFAIQTGVTTVQGALTIGKGGLVADRLVVR
jgi:hypothetical protein